MTKDFYQWILSYILNNNLKELIFLEFQLLACQNLRPLHLLGKASWVEQLLGCSWCVGLHEQSPARSLTGHN